MNIIFLPDKIRQAVGPALNDATPVLRCTGSLAAATGEGYLIGTEQVLFWFDRPAGRSDFQTYREDWSSPALNLTLTEESYRLNLDIASSQGNFRAVFSSGDRETVLKMIDLWQRVRAVPADAADAELTITPLAGMLAAMLLVSGSDETGVTADEIAYLRRFVIVEADLRLAEKIAAVCDHSRLIARLKPILNHDQALCLVANLVEIGMCDGSWGAAEQQLTGIFAAGLGVAEAELQNIVTVLLSKNCWRIMQ